MAPQVYAYIQIHQIEYINYVHFLVYHLYLNKLLNKKQKLTTSGWNLIIYNCSMAILVDSYFDFSKLGLCFNLQNTCRC